MVTEADIHLADGRTLHAYDTRADGIASGPGSSGSSVVVFLAARLAQHRLAA
jgi:hypothetical protein